MQALSLISRGLKFGGRALCRRRTFFIGIASNLAHRIAVLAMLVLLAVPALIAVGDSDYTALNIAFAAAAFSLSVGVILWGASSRIVLRRQGRGLTIFCLMLIAIGVTLKIDSNLRRGLAGLGQTIRSTGSPS